MGAHYGQQRQPGEGAAATAGGAAATPRTAALLGRTRLCYSGAMPPTLPQSEPELLLWAKNFLAKFPSEAPSLGFTNDEVDGAKADLTYLVFLLELVPQYRTRMQEVTAYKNLLKEGPVGAAASALPTFTAPASPPKAVAPGIVPRLQELVQRARKHPKCTEAVQKNLGIAGSSGEGRGVVGTVAPKAKLAALPASEVRIEFVRGDSDGVSIEGRREGEAEWRPLAVDRFSPYVDTRAPLQPGRGERREYRLRYLDGDDPVGPYSDVLVAHTVP